MKYHTKARFVHLRLNMVEVNLEKMGYLTLEVIFSSILAGRTHIWRLADIAEGQR